MQSAQRCTHEAQLGLHSGARSTHTARLAQWQDLAKKTARFAQRRAQAWNSAIAPWRIQPWISGRIGQRHKGFTTHCGKDNGLEAAPNFPWKPDGTIWKPNIQILHSWFAMGLFQCVVKDFFWLKQKWNDPSFSSGWVFFGCFLWVGLAVSRFLWGLNLLMWLTLIDNALAPKVKI